MENAALVASNPYIPSNALSVLEKLGEMPPSSDSDFTFSKEQFWLEGLSSRPKLRKKRKTASSSESESESDAEVGGAKSDPDDWRAFFEDTRPDTSKKSKSKSKDPGGGRRLYTLPIHAQLHTPAAHRAVFTRAWLALLPLLSRGGEVFISEKKRSEEEDQEGLTLVARALVVLHRGVLPYLTRAVLIMDWVSSCVDHGGYVGLLALNALFVLMREYNLYVHPISSSVLQDVLTWALSHPSKRLSILLYTPLRISRPFRPPHPTPCAIFPVD